MIKKSVLMMLALIFILSGFSLALAGSSGNYRKGKYLFRKNCRTCHASEGKGGELSPSSKTQAQWDRAFRPDNIAEYECKAEWAKLSPEDLKNIHAYLHKYAADSPTPAKCK